MQQRSNAVTIAVKAALTLVIGLPGFAIVGYLTSQNRNIGSLLALPLMGALLAVWFHKPKNTNLPEQRR